MIDSDTIIDLCSQAMMDLNLSGNAQGAILVDLTHQIAKQARTMTPVSKRLPDNHDICIVTDGHHYAESVYRDGVFELTIEVDEYFDEITHWMPEPEVLG